MMRMSQEANQTVTSVNGSELVIKRQLHAPRELVFEVWTDSNHLPNWWGPEGFTITVQEIDVRPGGVWRYVMHGPNGVDYDNKINYIEVAEPEKLVYAHGDNETEHFRVTVTFDDQGDQTELTMHMLFTSTEELERAVKEFGAIEGAASTMNRLEQQLVKIQDTASNPKEEMKMAENNVKNSMTKTVEGNNLTFTRIFDAPRDLVFKVLSDPEHLSHWWGPNGWTLPVNKMDFREGGSWHYCMESSDGEMKSWGKALYKEIVEPERIVYEDYFSDEEGNLNENMPGVHITLTLIEHEGKTKIVNHAQFSSEEALKTVMDMGMEQGFTETWDKLETHLNKIQ